MFGVFFLGVRMFVCPLNGWKALVFTAVRQGVSAIGVGYLRTLCASAEDSDSLTSYGR